MNPLSRVLAAAGALLTSATAAHAGVPGGTLVDYHVVGEVMGVAAHNRNLLATYGVTPGAAVDIVWTVDTSTAIYADNGPPDNVTYYRGAITWFKVEIGTWLAIRVNPPANHGELNVVAVADDFSGTLDSIHMSTPGVDNDFILRGGDPNAQLLLFLDFNDIYGNASSDKSLDQDPSRYPIGDGVAIGPGGTVTFRVTGGSGGSGGGGAGSDSDNCRKSQLASAAKLCQSQFKCQATYAKAPTKDPMGAKLDACMDKAGQSFTSAYAKAAAAAARKGLTCGTDESAVDQRDGIAARVESVADDVAAIAPAHPPLASVWLAAAGTACGSGLKAESAFAAKPGVSKLLSALSKASDKLESAANKAVVKAESNGVDFDPPADVPAFVDSVLAAIDETRADLNGD